MPYAKSHLLLLGVCVVALVIISEIENVSGVVNGRGRIILVVAGFVCHAPIVMMGTGSDPIDPKL